MNESIPQQLDVINNKVENTFEKDVARGIVCSIAAHMIRQPRGGSTPVDPEESASRAAHTEALEAEATEAFRMANVLLGIPQTSNK